MENTEETKGGKTEEQNKTGKQKHQQNIKHENMKNKQHKIYKTLQRSLKTANTHPVSNLEHVPWHKPQGCSISI